MPEVRKLEKRFVLFSAVLVLVFCTIIVTLLAVANVESSKYQTYTMMRQIAYRPALLDSPKDDAPFPYFAVTHSSEGDVIVGSGPVSQEVKEKWPYWVQTALSSPAETGEIVPDGYLWLKRSAGASSVIVFSSSHVIYRQMWTLILISSGVSLLVCLGFFLLARKLAIKATRPIRMAFEEQKRFVSDASHELKTPLTVILTNAELAASSDVSTEQARRYTQNVLSTAKRMKYLSEELLNLSRAEFLDSSNVAPADLLQVAKQCALSYEAVCFEEGHELITSFGAFEPLITPLPSQKGAQLISILLDNASKYAEGPGPIVLTVSKEGKSEVVLSVSNPSRAYNPEELAAMFSRFWRGDSARSHTGSYGLGLAIAKSLVENSKGKLAVNYNDGTITFVVHLPLV